MATGISLGVPVTDLAVSGGRTGEGTFSRDPSVVDSGFSGLVERLVPGDAPPDADRGGLEGSAQAADTWPRIPFDTTAPMSSWVEPARWKAEARAALLEDVASTRGPSGTDSLSVAADQVRPSDEADVDGGHETIAMSALPVVLAAPMRPPHWTADWMQAANGSGAPIPESTVDSTMDAPLDPAREWRHRHEQLAPVSRGQAPIDAPNGLVPEAGVAERGEVVDSFQPIRSSGTNKGPSSREDLDGASVSTRASQAARGAVERPHAEATRAAQSTTTDEARSAATAELRRALSQSRATSRVPSVAEHSPVESTPTHDPQAFRVGSTEVATSPQSQFNTGLPTVSAAWSDTAAGEHGRERPGSGAGVFDEHAQSLRRGPQGGGPLSGAADPFVLKDLSGFGARASAPQGQAPGDTLSDVPRQVVRAVHLQWRQGIGEARLQLKPDHLGHLTVTLRVESGLVTAVLRTESRTAMERIEAHQQELRAALEQQGLRLDRLVVEVDPDARGRRQPAESPLPEGRTNQPRDGQPEFDLGAFVSP